MAGRQRSTRGGFGLMLLAAQIMQIGPGQIPPVTLLSVIFNVVIYMRLIPNIPTVHGACTSNQLVVKEKQWIRLCTSSFYHLDDMHLYYNMVSFIWKGLKLERKMKSLKFLIVLILFSVLTQVVMLLLNQLFAEVFLSRHYLSTCAAGFSAVIFALKVLTTFRSEENVSLMGLPISIPSRYACWAELILIHFLVPNSSFTGHLAGIIVGLLYVYGPLKVVVKAVKHLLSGDVLSRSNQHPYTREAATTGRRDSDEDASVQEAIQESLRYTNVRPNTARNPAPSYGWNISPEHSSQRNQLYPNIPTNPQSDSALGPSAPPDYDGIYPTSNNAPYPTSNNAPYPTSNNAPYPTSNNAPYPTSNNSPYPRSNNSPYPTSNLPYPIQSNPPPYQSDFVHPPPSGDFAHPPSSGDFAHPPPSSDSPEEAMRKARLRKFDKNNR